MMNMRYIKFFGDAGICGTGYEWYIAFPFDTSDSIIEDWSVNYREENAEQYGWCLEDEENEDMFAEIQLDSCGWYEVTKEEWAENDGEEAFV